MPVDGDIELQVPADASLVLSLATMSGIHVAVGDVSFDGSGPLDRQLGAGGYRVIARSEHGSIRIVEGL